jgi:exoribonuclease-2
MPGAATTRRLRDEARTAGADLRQFAHAAPVLVRTAGSLVSDRDRLRAIARRAMRERGLDPDFPPAALAEAQAQVPSVPASSGVRDLRDRLWCSIDNDDSRDLDQLSVAVPGPGDATTIAVAIADVDARVPRGSALDDHARVNTTSVYTPAEVFAMLPERLSTDLTSLGEGQPRLAVVVEMQVRPDGELSGSSIFHAMVVNRARLAYGPVGAWLEAAAELPPAIAGVPGLGENLRLQDRAAAAMRERRHERGALELGALESHVVFDGEALRDLRPDEANRAKALIEDFMIAANSTTAEFLSGRGYATVRRVLSAPRRWDRLVELARETGTTLPPSPDARALNVWLAARRRADPARFADLSLSVVKLLGSGEYAVLDGEGYPANPQRDESMGGHFGLAVRDYTHSTAPNRRFPDLLTQRLVKAALAGAPAPYALDELQALAVHCTRQEDNAAKVERQVRKSAAALLFAQRIGERFDAIVTGVSEKGTWVRTLRPPVDGRVLRGEAGLDVGAQTRVELIGVDVDRGFIDFARAF